LMLVRCARTLLQDRGAREADGERSRCWRPALLRAPAGRAINNGRP
jgi:hypothetical protein